MKLLGLIFCLLFMCGLALGQSWLLYYSDTEVVNGDGSVTVTPTVLLWGDDGGSCSELDGQAGYDTPAVVLNGNAWVEGDTVLAGGAEGGGGLVQVANTFPNVTLPAGGTADLSYAGKVQQACGTQSTIWGSWPWGWSAFFSSSFFDGFLPNIPPAPCFLGTSCAVPFPNLYSGTPQHVVSRDIGSQQVAQFSAPIKYCGALYYANPRLTAKCDGTTEYVANIWLSNKNISVITGTTYTDNPLVIDLVGDPYLNTNCRPPMWCIKQNFKAYNQAPPSGNIKYDLSLTCGAPPSEIIVPQPFACQ